MFGGRRAIRVRAGSRSFASGVDTLANSPAKGLPDRDRGRRAAAESPLRKACERAKTAVAIACYPDGERDLTRLIDEELRTSNLRIAADARAVLMSLLGGDRQASRNELRKLALYAHGKGEIALDDVMTVVSDASELKLDPIVDGAFAGKPELVESEFAKAMVAGTYTGVIISAAQRGGWLHKSALAVAEGTPVSTLLESGYPRLHFSRKGAVEIALRNFSAARLVAIIDQLGTARARHAQAGLAGVRHRAAHAALDRGECETAGVANCPHCRGSEAILSRLRSRMLSASSVRFPQGRGSGSGGLNSPSPAFASPRRAVRGCGSDLDAAAGIAVASSTVRPSASLTRFSSATVSGSFAFAPHRRRAPSAACAPARPLHAPALRSGER